MLNSLDQSMRQLPCVYTTISLYDYVRGNIIDITTKAHGEWEG